MYQISDDELLSIRSYPESYTPQIIKNIELLSFSDEGAHPFGSYIYKIQKYPGDIDLVESFEECCSIKDVIKKFAKKLQKVVAKLVKMRKHYVTEIKAGEDLRYDINIGKLNEGIFFLANQKRDEIYNHTQLLFQKGLLNKNEIKIINAILNKKNRDLNQDDYDILYNLFREHKIIRWSDKEILQGYKILPGKKKITLQEALSMKGHVKIDMIVDINNKFTEMTNFLFLIVKKMDGKKYVINLGQKYTDDLIEKRIERELPIEIEKLFYSVYYYNPFKGVKRLWALARHYGDYTMIDKLKGFISGNISLLYQLKSEIENIIVLLKRLKTPPKVGINNQIQDIKSRLVYVLQISDDELMLDKLFNNAYETKNIGLKIELLNKIKKYMIVHINYFTMEFLNSVGIDQLKYPYILRNRAYEIAHILPYDTEKVKGGNENEIGGCDFCGGNIYSSYASHGGFYLMDDFPMPKSDLLDHYYQHEFESMLREKVMEDIIINESKGYHT